MDDILASNAISHLHNINNLIKNNTLTQYYYAKCGLLEAQNKLTLPARCKNTILKCPKCNINHTETSSTYRIEPNKKLIKLHSKLSQKHGLTKFQKIFLKKNDGLHKGNTLIITCGLCKNNVKKPLNKPANMRQDDEVVETIIKRKKQKKKKDKLSGLNRDAVSSASNTTTSRNTKSVAIKENTKEIPKVKPLLQQISKRQQQKEGRKEVRKTQQKMSRLSEMLKKGTKKGKGADLKRFLDTCNKEL